jgi:hypothetical protein
VCVCACVPEALAHLLAVGGQDEAVDDDVLEGCVCVCARARERVCTRPLTMTLLQAACEKKLYDSLVLK